MSAASNMIEEGTDSLLWHAETPDLVVLAKQTIELRNEIFVRNGIVWKSKQWRPKSKLPVEEVVKTAHEFAHRRESLQAVAHTIVHRGEFPVNDSIMDDLLIVLQTELSDMIGCLAACAASAAPWGCSNKATAAASVGAGVAAAEGEMSLSSRKRSYSDARKDENTRKGPEEARVASSASASAFSSDPMPSVVAAASSEELSQCQKATLLNWVQKNNFNISALDGDAIDELTGSTGLKTCQVVAWITRVGAMLAKCRTADTIPVPKQLEVIVIDDGDDDDEEKDDVSVGVPELADEEDAEELIGLFAEEGRGPDYSNSSDGVPVQEEEEEELSATQCGWSSDYIIEALKDAFLSLDGGGTELDDLEPLDLGTGFDFGGSELFKGASVEYSSASCEWSGDYEGKLPKGRYLHLDSGDLKYECENDLQRPSKRARSDSDSLDSLLALLD